jgi:preprotein translocase subunit SecE
MSRDLIWVLVIATVAGGLFAWLWRGGYLVRLADYIRATREELKKCSWPSWDELKGSTLVVAVSIGILGIFTIAVDQVFFYVFVMLLKV